LTLSHTDITDAILVDLRRFPSLRRLDLEDTLITEAGSSDLGNLQTLTHLNLIIEGSLTDKGLRPIARLRNLVDLDLSYSSITDAGLAELCKLRELRRLVIRNTRITDAGLIRLRDLPHLTELNVVDTEVTHAGLEKLLEATTLKRLDCSVQGLTDDRVGELKILARNPSVYLSLSGKRISDAGLKRISEFTNLKEIDLGGMPVTDSGLRELAGLSSLTELRLGHTQTTDAGMKSISELPNIELRISASRRLASWHDSSGFASTVRKSPTRACTI
jgi:internalin A